jgi:hypothetical protein
MPVLLCSDIVLCHRHFVVQCFHFSPGAEKDSVPIVPVMNPDNGVEFARSEKGEYKYLKVIILLCFVRKGSSKVSTDKLTTFITRYLASHIL